MGLGLGLGLAYPNPNPNLGHVDQLVDDLVRVQCHLRPLGGEGQLVAELQVVPEHRRPQLLVRVKVRG